jgi:hypothetical protein
MKRDKIESYLSVLQDILTANDPGALPSVKLFPIRLLGNRASTVRLEETLEHGDQDC